MNCALEIPQTKSQYRHNSSYEKTLDDKLNIVLVEDLSSDIWLAKKSLDASEIPYNLDVLRKGELLVPHLFKGNLPDLIMLDIGLPDMDGFEVLSALSTQSAILRSIPIVIVTGYKHFNEYVQNHYSLYIMGYIDKPYNTEQICNVLSRIRNDKYAPQ
ncbi:MAG: response regulator [Rickettsiales bacterium]